jgi:outer membrane biosynthesis protein TonB
MRTDILFSVVLHLAVLAALVVGSPFNPRVSTDIHDVIRVSLTSLPYAATPQSKPAAIPKAATPEETAALLPESKPAPKAKPVDKPKEKKKKDKKKKTAIQKAVEEKIGVDSGVTDISENLGIGSPFGGAAIDNASFNYPYWFVQSFSKIERNWNNPVYANQPLSCIIYFQTIRSGRIIKIETEISSGIDAYDRACERAIRLSEPFPPLPEEFTEEILGIHLEFPYVPR